MDVVRFGTDREADVMVAEPLVESLRKHRSSFLLPFGLLDRLRPRNPTNTATRDAEEHMPFAL
jgi:hypothetical protein